MTVLHSTQDYSRPCFVIQDIIMNRLYILGGLLEWLEVQLNYISNEFVNRKRYDATKLESNEANFG